MKATKKIILILLILMLAIGVLCVLIYKEDTAITHTQEKEAITVLIEGEVQTPGEYTLFQGMRVNDAVVAAGGVSEKGDPSGVNLAAFLSDGQKITVPEKPLSADNRININTATEERLVLLPGIGEVKAKAIITYREANGPFRIPEDLLGVKGIGEKTLENIRELLEF